MTKPKFTEIISFSNQEIYEKIREMETELFHLRFKLSTRQKLKSHQISQTKRRLAQLKTLLTLRLQDLPDQK